MRTHSCLAALLLLVGGLFNARGESAAFAVAAKVDHSPGTGSAHHEFGWENAAAFCGLRDANLPGAPIVGQDAVWYISYNKDALFLQTMSMLKPQGESFLARTTEDNDPALFDDDHMVAQIAIDPRTGEAGVPFLRVAINPHGAVWAETVEALPGQNHPLDTRLIARGKVDSVVHAGRGKPGRPHGAGASRLVDPAPLPELGRSAPQ